MVYKINFKIFTTLHLIVIGKMLFLSIELCVEKNCLYRSREIHTLIGLIYECITVTPREEEKLQQTTMHEVLALCKRYG